MFPLWSFAAVLLVGGCGGSSDTAPARDVVDSFVTALADNDSAKACSLFAPQTVRRMDSLRPEGCPQALPTLRLPVDRSESIAVWGDTAQVRTSGDTLFLRKFTQGWRVVAAGCVPRGSEPYQCKVDGA